MNRRFLDRTIALLLLAAGGLGGVVLSAQPWWRLTGHDLDPAASAGAGVQTTITGTTATAGLSQALAIAVLAAALLALTMRRTGRRVVGVACVLLGLGMAVLGGRHPHPDSVLVHTALRQVTLADGAVLRPAQWVWAYLAAGLAVAAGGAVMALRAGRWPSRAGRYESPALQAAGQRGGPRTPGGAPASTAPATDDPDTWWRAMDAGVDPTAGEPESASDLGAPTDRGGPAGAEQDGHPVSPSARSSATMAQEDVTGSSEDP